MTPPRLPALDYATPRPAGRVCRESSAGWIAYALAVAVLIGTFLAFVVAAVSL